VPRLKTIEQTTERMVLREHPLYFSAIIPFVFSTVPLFALATVHELRQVPFAFMLPLVSMMFFAVTLFGLVDSTFCISRTSGTLRITRKFLWWSMEKTYPASDVLTIFEARSIKGNRLMMHLRSGEVRRFALYMQYGPRDAEAAAVNQYLHWVRESGSQASAGDPFVH
jgi:hypothetical protein